MNPTSATKQTKVAFNRLEKNDVGQMIRQNIKVLETSYVLVCARKREVFVRNGSPADLIIRKAHSGDVVPLGIQKVDGIVYRSYFVSPDLLQTLEIATTAAEPAKVVSPK